MHSRVFSGILISLLKGIILSSQRKSCSFVCIIHIQYYICCDQWINLIFSSFLIDLDCGVFGMDYCSAGCDDSIPVVNSATKVSPP